jgi:hypothetical protein
LCLEREAGVGTELEAESKRFIFNNLSLKGWVKLKKLMPVSTLKSLSPIESGRSTPAPNTGVCIQSIDAPEKFSERGETM